MAGLRSLLLAVCAISIVQLARADSDHSSVLDVDDSGVLLFKYIVLPGAEEIEFELCLRGVGWVGLGFGNMGMGHSNADMYMGRYIAFKKKAELFDYWSRTRAFPTLDEQQDAVVLGGSYMDGYTTLRFKRKLITGDPNDRDIILGAETTVFFAWNATSLHLGYHGENNRVQRTVVFTAHGDKEPVSEPTKIKGPIEVLKETPTPTKAVKPTRTPTKVLKTTAKRPSLKPTVLKKPKP